MIDRIIVLWIIIMFVSAILGLTCDSIFGIEVINIVITLIGFWWCCFLFECFVMLMKRIKNV